MTKPLIIVIEGPTASGKTSLSIELAKKIGGEIVCADSMQVYKEMNIGTAKVTREEMQGIPHYVMDFVNVDQRFSVADYKKQAKKAIKQILEKGKIPIVVGGTGLYIDALIYEIEYLEKETDLAYREQLEQEVEKVGLEELYKKAEQIDAEATHKISKTDKKRILRILELYHQTGKTKTQLEKESRQNPLEYNYKVFALTWERETLYDRINQRVEQMIQQGLIQEVETIWKKYSYFPTAMQALGYKEVVEYLEKKVNKEEMIENIKRETRRYAKRQLTWFRKNKQVIWLAGENKQEDNIHTIWEVIRSEEGNKG